MKRLNITAKIWLSIGVFVLGFVFTTVLGQIEALSTEAPLRTTADALFPSAQASQEAEAAYQRMIKGFSDAVMTQDASALERAAGEGRQVVEGLKRVASIRGLAGARAAEVGQLAAAVEQYVTDAQAIYGTALANPAALTADVQQKMRDLAGRSDTVKASLTQTREGVPRRCGTSWRRCAIAPRSNAGWRWACSARRWRWRR